MARSRCGARAHAAGCPCGKKGQPLFADGLRPCSNVHAPEDPEPREAPGQAEPCRSRRPFPACGARSVPRGRGCLPQHRLLEHGVRGHTLHHAFCGRRPCRRGHHRRRRYLSDLRGGQRLCVLFPDKMPCQPQPDRGGLRQRRLHGRDERQEKSRVRTALGSAARRGRRHDLGADAVLPLRPHEARQIDDLRELLCRARQQRHHLPRKKAQPRLYLS